MLIHAISAYGLVVLFLAVGLESAGMPLPGEATLIAAAVLASQAQLDIVAVIVVAAIAAILGGAAAYIIGRTGARPVLLQWRLARRSAEGWLSRAERLFERYGGLAVFLARFIVGVRVIAALAAGLARMPWWQFFLWNATGGIVWAAGISLVAYSLGRANEPLLRQYGIVSIGIVVAALLALLAMHQLLGRRQPGVGADGSRRSSRS